MKKKSLVGIALAAVLAMGVTPAFAAEGAGVDVGTTEFGVDNTASTALKVSTVAGQITATVPLAMTFALPLGGGDFSAGDGAPSAAAYKITNNSIWPIKVTEIKTVTQDNWVLASSDPGDPSGQTAANILIKANAAVSSGTDPAEITLSAANKDADVADWKIGKKPTTADDSNVLSIDFSGKVSKIVKPYDTAGQVASITYTIAVDNTTI